jgi:hypothetical protein
MILDYYVFIALNSWALKFLINLFQTVVYNITKEM